MAATTTSIAYLGFNQDEVDEEHHEVVLDILVAEAAALAADGQADVVPRRLVTGARVLSP